MLEGIALLAVVSAAITSTFVARAARESDVGQANDERSDTERIEARLDILERSRQPRLDASGLQFDLTGRARPHRSRASEDEAKPANERLRSQQMND